MSGFVAVTTMKNEGAFLLEWVAHHKALGFDHLVICTNDCADPTRKMALRLQEMGLAVHHATRVWASTSIQRSALKQATRLDVVRAADWIYVCDADEFLCSRIGDGSVQALVAAARPEAEVISVPWRIFGPDGRETYEDSPVTRQFTRARRAGPGDAPGFAYPKSLVRGLSLVHRLGIHAPTPAEGLGRDLVRDLPGGRPHVPQHHPMFVLADYTHAQVNHYALRSAESFLVKRERGRVNHVGQDMGIEYWDRFDIAEVPCDLIRRHDGAVGGWLDRLMADPTLAFLHRKAVAWHRARILALRSDPANTALLDHIRSKGAPCASLPS